jgi:hypothetical protein
MGDCLTDSTARLKQLLTQVMKESDPLKGDELCVEALRLGARKRSGEGGAESK